VAAQVGFCALDRGHEPLRGDEVRACWEDGAVPIAPEPSIPGLLDLLSERAMPEVVAPVPIASPGATDPIERPNPALRLRPTTPVVVRRDWVEVEA